MPSAQATPRKSILKRTKPASACPSSPPSTSPTSCLSSSPSSTSSFSSFGQSRSRSSSIASSLHSNGTSIGSGYEGWGYCSACGSVGHGHDIKPLPTTLTDRLSVEIIDAILSHLASHSNPTSRPNLPHRPLSPYPYSAGSHSSPQVHLHYFAPGASHPSLSTLRNCTIVSKAWFPLARSYLFQSRKLLLSKANVYSFLSTWRHPNESLGTYIKHLAIQQEDPSSLFQPVLERSEDGQNARTGTPSGGSTPTPTQSLNINLPHTLIPKFSLYPFLTSLCLSWIQSPLTPLTISCLAKGFPSLTSLEFRACSFSSLSEFALIVSGHAGLKRMALSDVEWFEDSVPDMSGREMVSNGKRKKTPDFHRFPGQLTTLELFITHSTYFVEWLLSYDLPVLEDVRLGSAFWDADDAASVGALLRQVGRSLKYLTMCSPSHLSEVDLTFNPNLHSISISHLQIELPPRPAPDWFSSSSHSESMYVDEEKHHSRAGTGRKPHRRNGVKSKSKSSTSSHGSAASSESDSDLDYYDSPISNRVHENIYDDDDDEEPFQCPITRLLTQLRSHPRLELISFSLLFKIPTSQALPLIDWNTISYLLADSNPPVPLPLGLEGVGVAGGGDVVGVDGGFGDIRSAPPSPTRSGQEPQLIHPPIHQLKMMQQQQQQLQWEQQQLRLQQQQLHQYQEQQQQHDVYRQRADGLPPPSPLRVRPAPATSSPITSTTTSSMGQRSQLQSVQPLNIRSRSPTSSPSSSPSSTHPPPSHTQAHSHPHSHSHPHLHIQTQNLHPPHSTAYTTMSMNPFSSFSSSATATGTLFTPIILTTPATPPTPLTPPGTATQASYNQQVQRERQQRNSTQAQGQQAQAQNRPPSQQGTHGSVTAPPRSSSRNSNHSNNSHNNHPPRSFPSLNRLEIRVPKISGGPPSENGGGHGKRGAWWGSRKVRAYIEERLKTDGWIGVDNGVLFID